MLTSEYFPMYKRLLASRKLLLASVCVLSVCAALLEGISLALIYPLLDSVIGAENDQGRVWQALRELAQRVSGTSVIEGLLYLFIGVFFLKAIILTLTTATKSILQGRLRQDWSVAALEQYLYGPYSEILAQPRGQIIQNVSVEPLRAAEGIGLIITVP